jgi:dienelactone hydrolase
VVVFDQARRFADAGYAALAPNLYSHGSRIVCLSRVMVDMPARVPTPLAVGYDEAAERDGWKRMLAFFEEHVRSPALS